ncbi:hypothetical protein SODALDRAFT_375060 [Sodiomyces alkalinus F11]|uniref:RING-type domain-containing protein n=1 Tax=Sodiomyces alkalinus (strain CBS 110278 / VKM F-3762 / F11) TaxID=1314773 RepID=A0A3N2Q7Y7_SODAK|nr:hypothetical protein SODALDRAFT_375060 [Sodiomyces alkalinus F11]ROT42797.1 hypothetical protein SODALDRAFT_375060 [Sodiomyces alkalinus F11]
MSDDGPPLFRPVPRRPFKVNLEAPTSRDDRSPSPNSHHDADAPAASPQYNGFAATTPSESTSLSRTQSVINLTGSTLSWIYSPLSSSKDRFGREELDSPWGTGAQTPIKRPNLDDATFEVMKQRSALRNKRSAHANPYSTLPSSPKSALASTVMFASRIVLLFLLGMGYGVLVTRLHDGQRWRALSVDGIINTGYNWTILVFWGAAGVLLGALLPWFDGVWERAFGDDDAAAAGREDDSPDSEEDNRGTDWTLMVRGIGAFVGIVFAIRRLPWTSSLQASLTLALVNPFLWYLIDRSKPGFLLSAAVGLVGSAVLLGVNPDIMPTPSVMPHRNASASEIHEVPLSFGGFAKRETVEAGIWMLSVLFCSCVCFGNIGRRLALSNQPTTSQGRLAELVFERGHLCFFSPAAQEERLWLQRKCMSSENWTKSHVQQPRPLNPLIPSSLKRFALHDLSRTPPPPFPHIARTCRPLIRLVLRSLQDPRSIHTYALQRTTKSSMLSVMASFALYFHIPSTSHINLLRSWHITSQSQELSAIRFPRAVSTSIYLSGRACRLNKPRVTFDLVVTTRHLADVPFIRSFIHILPVAFPLHPPPPRSDPLYPTGTIYTLRKSPILASLRWSPKDGGASHGPMTSDQSAVLECRPSALTSEPPGETEPQDGKDHGTPGSFFFADQIRGIVRLIQCKECFYPLREPVTLPCGRSLCRSCLPESRTREHITYPALPSRLQGFSCPFPECGREHAVGDCSTDVVLSKVIDHFKDVMDRAKAVAATGEVTTHVMSKDPWVVAGVGSLAEHKIRSRVVPGGRLLATYSMVEAGELEYETEASYCETSSAGEEAALRADHVLFTMVKEIIRTEMDCQICYAIFHDPITTVCGHTFCRRCLHRVLDHALLCPICRRGLSISPLLHRQSCPPNHCLSKIIDVFWPDAVEARENALLSEVLNGHRDFDIPLFICTLAFPLMPTFLHIFEPLYRLMIRRALEGNRMFGMVPPSLPHRANDMPFMPCGTVLRIVNAEYFEDGRSLIETVGVSRFRVLRHGILEGGYTAAKTERIDDVSVAEEEDREVAETQSRIGSTVEDSLSEPTRGPNTAGLTYAAESLDRMPTRQLLDFAIAFVRRMQQKSVPWLANRILAIYGECPDDGARFPWWFASILPVKDAEKYRLLETTSVRERLKICCHWAIEWESTTVAGLALVFSLSARAPSRLQDSPNL